MQKVAVFFLLLVAGCTIVKKQPPETIGLIVFDEVSEGERFYQASKLKVSYRVCAADTNLQKDNEARTDLTHKFQEKFGVRLVGLSKLTIESTRIVDSSIFVPNETCSEMTFYPVTSQKLDAKGFTEWLVETNLLSHSH